MGGQVVQYKGLTFATVRNAGHMVSPDLQWAMSARTKSMFLSCTDICTMLMLCYADAMMSPPIQQAFHTW